MYCNLASVCAAVGVGGNVTNVTNITI